MRLSPLVLALALIFSGSRGLAAGDAALTAAARQARPAAIRAHMQFLASDLLEGREPGTRGYDVAAQYVAAVLESYGLEAAGTGGSFLQDVWMRRIERDDSRSLLQVMKGDQPVDLTRDRDYVTAYPTWDEERAVSAPLAFVGYGIDAPERSRDDYKGIDLKGKIAVFATGAPPDFPAAVRAYYSDGQVKVRAAVAHGAVGVLSLTTDESDKLFAWPRLVEYVKAPGLRVLMPNGDILDSVRELKTFATLGPEGSRKLMAAVGRDWTEMQRELEKGAPKPFDMGLQAAIRSAGRHSELHSPNVVAILRGSDPRLAGEYVVYSAHLDHVGIGRSIGGDAIYNGAVDNASGSAALLEIARMFSAMPVKPRRSIVFLFVTAEERGLLGSAYFAAAPTVPIESIVANINIDGLTMFYPVRDVVPIGAEHSTLDRTVADAAAVFGLEVSPDPMPEQVFFIRSDQYSFVKKGVPSTILDAGLKSEGVNATAVMEKWFEERYHRPGDDMTQPFRFEEGARLVGVEFLVGAMIANANERPMWLPGSFFGEKFGRR